MKLVQREQTEMVQRWKENVQHHRQVQERAEANAASAARAERMMRRVGGRMSQREQIHNLCSWKRNMVEDEVSHMVIAASHIEREANDAITAGKEALKNEKQASRI